MVLIVDSTRNGTSSSIRRYAALFDPSPSRHSSSYIFGISYTTAQNPPGTPQIGPRRSLPEHLSPHPTMSETDYDSFTSLPLPTHKTRRPALTYGKRGAGASSSRRVFTSKVDTSSEDLGVGVGLEWESVGKREREEEEAEGDCETSGEESRVKGSREKVCRQSFARTRPCTHAVVLSR